MYEQPKLGFEIDGLEPHLDRENLDVHYNKHHVAYIKKFNDAVRGTQFEDVPLKNLLIELESLPSEIKNLIRNNGGGSWNHSFFWSVLTPERLSGKPRENTLAMIEESFGSYEEFKEKFSAAALGVFGSGWAWLVVNSEGKLEIITTANQDCPLTKGQKPILTLDVWEHAYYLKYKNLRADYIKAFFNVVNWQRVEEYLME